MNLLSTLKGSCRCGRVEIEVTGGPVLTMACHCTGCQKMTASAFSLSTLYRAENFKVTKGETVLGGRQIDHDHRCCDHCKSWMFTTFDGPPAFVNVRAMMLDNAATFTPFLESYTCEKLPWAKTGAPHAYEKFPSEAEYEQLMAEFAQSPK
ncbi:MAG: GFA family protein [Alphaproteobacteria bacterium]|nr:MAG: GFA family protein [Alphaproteobacteria bacterium]